MAAIREQIRVTFQKDGVDHVNISERGETHLGNILSQEWRKKFFIPHVGEFVSPRAFANWAMSGGDETLRHSAKPHNFNGSLAEFKNLVIFGKYYQLCSLRSHIIEKPQHLELPWISYKSHYSGIREYNRWEAYCDIMRDLVSTIVLNGNRSRFDWDMHYPEVLFDVDRRLKVIAGEEYTSFTKIDVKTATTEVEEGDTPVVEPETGATEDVENSGLVAVLDTATA